MRGLHEAPLPPYRWLALLPIVLCMVLQPSLAGSPTCTVEHRKAEVQQSPGNSDGFSTVATWPPPDLNDNSTREEIEAWCRLNLPGKVHECIRSLVVLWVD